MSELLKLAAKQKPVRQRRSRLDPYLSDLRKLQEQGYTLEQMTGMLAKLGVEVTKQGLSDFLKRRAETPANGQPGEEASEESRKTGLVGGGLHER